MQSLRLGSLPKARDFPDWGSRGGRAKRSCCICIYNIGQKDRLGVYCLCLVLTILRSMASAFVQEVHEVRVFLGFSFSLKVAGFGGNL